MSYWFSVKNALWYGADHTGMSDSGAAIALAMEGGGTVAFPAGRYKYSGRIDIPANTRIIALSPGGVFFDSAAVNGLQSALCGDNVEIDGVVFTSSTYTTVEDTTAWEMNSRCLKAGNDNTFSRVTVENAGMGFEITGVSRVKLTQCKARNVKTRYGHCAAFHVSNSSFVSGDVVSAIGCDRICENEDGAHDVRWSNGYAKDCGLGPYSGAPVTYFGYTMGLNAHNHAGPDTGAVYNIVFDTWLLENVGCAIDVSQDSANPVENIAYRNIVVNGISDAWVGPTQMPVRIAKVSGLTLDNLIVKGAATSKEYVVSIVGKVDGLRINGGKILSGNEKFMVFEANCEYAEVAGMQFGPTTLTGGAGVIMKGKNCKMRDCSFNNVKGLSSSNLQIDGQSNQAINCRFTWDSTGSNPPYMINIRSSGTLADGCFFDGDGMQRNIRLSNAASQCTLINHQMLNANATPRVFEADAGCNSNLFAQNRWNQSGRIITDNGTGNVLTMNNDNGTITA